MKHFTMIAVVKRNSTFQRFHAVYFFLADELLYYTIYHMSNLCRLIIITTFTFIVVIITEAKEEVR